MKIVFRVDRPLRDPEGLQNFKQSAKLWLGVLLSSLEDQLKDKGPGKIQMDIEGVVLEFKVVTIPGFLSTKTIELTSNDEDNGDRIWPTERRPTERR